MMELGPAGMAVVGVALVGLLEQLEVLCVTSGLGRRFELRRYTKGQ